MKLVKKLVSANRRSFFILAVTSILSGGLNALFLAVITYSMSNLEADIVMLALLFAGVCLGIIAIRHLHRYIAIKVANVVFNRLRVQLSRLIQNCSVTGLEEKGKAHLMTVLTDDLSTISGFVISLPMMLGNVTFLTGAAIYLAWISDAVLFTALILVGAVIMKVYGMVMAMSKKYYERAREEAEAMMGHQTDLIAGYKELKMDRELALKLIRDCIEPTNERLADLRMKAGMRHAFGLGFGMSLIYGFIGIVIFTFPHLFGYSPGVVLGYVFAIIYAAGPLQSIIDIYPAFVRAGVSIGKIEQLENDLLQTQENTGERNITMRDAGFSEIKLVNVEFSYRGRKGQETHLGPFNLTVKQNEVLFLAGGNGSGKTTLSKLICGLYSPSSGQILLDGEPVREWQLPDYRTCFSTLFSDFHILRSSSNIYDFEKVTRSDLLSGFGLDKRVFTRQGLAESDELSQGQRRRLALLMTIHAGKSIFIFDEPGSDLDPGFKGYFYRQVIPYLKERQATVIVVTHDNNYFRFADRLIILRDGKIVDEISMEGESGRSGRSLEGAEVLLPG